MCNVGDDNIEDLENIKYMPVKEKLSPFSKCNKCREQTSSIVLRSKDKYCKSCFLAGTVHKFKALLGKHKLIRPNEKVMIVHKCGHPSTALLHFVKTGIELETHKKLHFDPVVLFIEDYLHLSLEERQDLIKKVEKEVGSFKFPMHFTASAKLITDDGIKDDTLKSRGRDLELTDSDSSIVHKFLEKQVNNTNKNDFWNIVMQKFLIKIAKQLECKYIFIPELSSDVASKLLIDVSLGRGDHISLNTGFCDSRDDAVKILRPLRLFDAKELALYNYLNNLEPVTFRIPLDNPYKSVQQLMKKFVNDLQVNYPATVTTILKTGDKLTVSNKLRNKCEFCGAPIGKERLELTSAESTQFSHWVSTRPPDTCLTPQERYASVSASFDNLNSNDYCFGCKMLHK
jgi:cytoplasmic tRNA 2-thiolation protein 2